MDRVEHDLSEEQWTALKAAWGGCAYCGATDRPLQRDCVLALSRGGRYTLENIAPACSSCNASKCNDEVTGWLRRKRFGERGFLERDLQIKASLALRFASASNTGRPSPETTASLAPAEPDSRQVVSTTPRYLDREAEKRRRPTADLAG